MDIGFLLILIVVVLLCLIDRRVPDKQMYLDTLSFEKWMDIEEIRLKIHEKETIWTSLVEIQKSIQELEMEDLVEGISFPQTRLEDRPLYKYRRKKQQGGGPRPPKPRPSTPHTTRSRAVVLLYN